MIAVRRIFKTARGKFTAGSSALSAFAFAALFAIASAGLPQSGDSAHAAGIRVINPQDMNQALRTRDRTGPESAVVGTWARASRTPL